MVNIMNKFANYRTKTHFYFKKIWTKYKYLIIIMGLILIILCLSEMMDSEMPFLNNYGPNDIYDNYGTMIRVPSLINTNTIKSPLFHFTV